MKSKKGAEMTIGTIIVIILALVVLVVLIYGFSTGWSNLWQNILGYGGGTVNVQTVVDSCKLACTAQQSFDYCSKKRTIVFELVNGKKNPADGSYTCDELAKLSGVNTGLGCDALDCVDAVGAKGVCSGTPNPPCSAQTNKGATNCEGASGVYGCKWVATTGATDPNLGTCARDTTLKCASFNNDENACRKLLCNWVATP
jgi:hypothetical protein